MKIMTVLGTRPEIIRLSVIMAKLDRLCDHVVVHTGQNSDRTLKEVFLRQLGVRSPDHDLKAQGSFGAQLACLMPGIERLMLSETPDRLLILGDTNSALAAVMAKRLAIPVYHMEAGNRCYDDRVPEEVNRRIIDHSSDVLMPYTERSRQNLLREGIPGERIYVTGNPIGEVIAHYESQTSRSTVLADFGLAAGRYILVTMHRAENVDVPERLTSLLAAFDRVQREHGVPVIVSTHPRTRLRLKQQGVVVANPELRFLDPFGFFEFITLERNALCVLSDSGTVQEECAIFKVPNVTIRDVTERPETLECGSNILSGADTDTVLRCVRTVLSRPPDWDPPVGYVVPHVSDTVVRILTGFFHRR